MLTRSRLGMVLAVWMALATGAHAQPVIEAPQISVTGTAEVEATPDAIEWRILLTDKAMDPRTAKIANDTRFEAVLEAADDMDLPAEDVRIGTVAIRRLYHHDRNTSRTIFDGHQIQRQIILVQRDLEAFDDMLDALAVLGVEFEVGYSSSQIQALKEDARLNAVRAARDKAQAMAQVLGQEIGRPLYIEEISSGGHGFDLNNAGSNTRSGDRQAGEGMASILGAISASVKVKIVFDLIDPEIDPEAD